MTATPLPSDDLGGRVLGGRYRIKSLRGKGGMGAVWVAYDDVDKVDVAIKVVRAALLEDPQAMGRFKREAKVIRGLDHPGIVRSLDAGEDEGMLWIAMELLDGETLRQRLDGRGRMTWDESLAAAKSILGSLAAAHAAGVIHRDLKPDNVMMLADGRIKLLDFGVAKQSHLESSSIASSMTGTGFIVGTPGYVAPEVVLEGKNDDPRSDLYAFGVLWFEMLTGQKPFTAKTPFALAMRHAHEPAPRASTLLPFSPIPLAVENLVAQLMAKSPEERPPSAGAVLDLIDAIERGAAQAATGTPTPGAIDRTETDIRDTPQGTAVVPMKLTPSDPRSVMASNTPAPTVPTVPTTSTPPTGMHTGTPVGGPIGSPLPGLFKALPKKHKAAAVASIVLMVFGLVSLMAVVVEVTGLGAEVQPDTAPRVGNDVSTEGGGGGGGGGGVRNETLARTPPASVQHDEPPAIPDKPEPRPAAIVVSATDVAVTSEVAVKPEGIAQKLTRKKRVAAEGVAPPAPPPPPVVSAAAGASVETRVRTFPPAKITLDGEDVGDSPLVRALRPGNHELRFKVRRSDDTLEDFGTFNLTVKPGECRAYNLRLARGAPATHERQPTDLECPR